MKNNSVQFAVVREDPQIEMDVIADFGLNRATLIASGGCTAFCLKASNPDLEIALIEPNPAQIELVKKKIQLLKNGEKEVLDERFGVGNSDENSLIECGNFESLFRQFRFFVREFVASETEIENAFLAGAAPRFWTDVFAHRFWKVAFELFFSDSILTATFGNAAIRHAPKNSYPNYFQNALEKGLLRADASRNYFLHHIFLGRYLNDETALPVYLVNRPTNLEFEFFDGFAQNYRNFRGKQLADFSNIFDWCDETIVRDIAGAATNLEKGSVVVFRRLNNDKNYRSFFGADFRWLPTESVLKKDRSLFYSKIEIGEKIR